MGGAQGGGDTELGDIGPPGPVLVLWRHRMGAKEAGDNAHRAVRRKRAGGAQHVQLGLAVQPVARFHLDHRHALGHHRIDARQGLGDQRVHAGRAGRRHGRKDATARARDFFIGSPPVQSHLELRRTVAAMHHMGVAVDQRGGGDKAVTQRGGLRQVCQGCGQLVLGGADPGDLPAFNRNRGVVDQPIARPPGKAAARSCVKT